MKHRVFLVPGFFGFVNLGELLYFAHVRDVMERACRRQGLKVKVEVVDVHPTASLRHRATLLAEEVHRRAQDDEALHLVGHSTGGLDTRLVCTPGVSLNTTLDIEALAERVQSVVTLSTPHFGTPLASFFSSVFGLQLLKLLAVVTAYTLRYGHLPLSGVLKIASVVSRFDDYLGWKDTVIDQVFEQLLGDFSPERRRRIEEFVADLRVDQGLFNQLTEDGADLFNASTGNRPTVRYGSVVTRAAPQTLKTIASLGCDPYAHASHVSFLAFEHIVRRNRRRFPVLPASQAEKLARVYGQVPSAKDNDGVVPTRSQIWGDIIHVARADHLDTIGHFNDPSHDPPHYDWMSSGSGFRRPQFEALWRDVAQFIADS